MKDIDFINVWIKIFYEPKLRVRTFDLLNLIQWGLVGLSRPFYLFLSNSICCLCLSPGLANLLLLLLINLFNLLMLCSPLLHVFLSMCLWVSSKDN